MTSKQSSAENVREETVNTILAQILGTQGVAARAERRSKQGIPDVRIDLRTGDLVLLECKWEGSRRLLETQLDERLKQFPESLGTIGVEYPVRLRNIDDIHADLETATDLNWWVHGYRGKPNSDRRIRSGSVAELADQLRALPLELEGTDRVEAAAGIVGFALEQSAKELSGHARISRRIAEIIAKTDQENDRSAALRIACLVLFNALAFQDRLASVNDDVPTVLEATGNGDNGLRNAWQHICHDIDYVPVFELATSILDAVGDGPAELREAVVSPLVKAMENTRTLEGHDLSGRLFHTLLTEAKFSGAYYTSVPAATLLTRLVFDDWPKNIDWSDHEFPASLNIADLACGTGTLLIAVASEVERRHTNAGGRRASDLHKAMVEQALHGYDVQLSAVHFAATSLAMLNPEIQFDRMNLYVMPLGDGKPTPKLGSLDFLRDNQVPVQFALSEELIGGGTKDAERVSGSGTKGVGSGVIATLPDLDLAIMNPPFTRSVGGNLLFGSLPAAERRKLQVELSKRLKTRQASSTAGLGAAFVAAASPKLRRGDGRLALVLPATVCTGPSWAQTRSLIEHDFNLDMVITSHDPSRWNFSDSTDLSEAMLIATRRPLVAGKEERRTTFVNLWQNPNGVLDAHRVASAISTTPPANIEEEGTSLLEVDGHHVGETISIPEGMFGAARWTGVQFARADVLRASFRLVNNGEVWVPGQKLTGHVNLCELIQIAEVGPDRRRLVDGFDRTNTVTAYPMVEGHETEQRRSLRCSPNVYLSPLAKPKGGQKPGYGEHLWQQSGHLLIAERLWLETTRVLAMRSDARVLSNVWWPIMTAGEFEKPLAVWFNSSLGLLSILAQRTTTRGCWVAIKKGDLESLQTLDLRSLSTNQIAEMSSLFDDLADMEFERLPAMNHCPARQQLDEGIAEILGLPNLGTLRNLLASEPVVSNRRL